MNKEQQLREAIIKAVPEIMEEGEYINDFRNPIGRPITLTDVLRAIDKTDLTKTKQYVEEKWTMPEFAGHIVLKLIDMWDLTKDYDNQPQPVKDFLYNLLVEHE